MPEAAVAKSVAGDQYKPKLASTVPPSVSYPKSKNDRSSDVEYPAFSNKFAETIPIEITVDPKRSAFTGTAVTVIEPSL